MKVWCKTDLSKNFFGGFFDFNRDGKTSVFKQSLGLSIIDECSKNNEIKDTNIKTTSEFRRNRKPRKSTIVFLSKGIRDEEQRIMDLSKLARESGNNQEKFEAAIADCTKRIKILREKKEQVIRQLNFNEEAKKEMDRIKSYLAEDRAVVDKFDDSTVRRLVNQIVVSEDLKLTIYIKGGYEIEEQYLPRPKSA